MKRQNIKTRDGKAAWGNRTKRMTLLLLFGVLMATIWGCQPAESGEKKQKLRIVATTGMIADAAKQMGGDFFDVTALMGPGVDPHLYKATQNDLSRLQSADLILYNGLHLEGKMAEIFEKLSKTRAVYAVANVLPQDTLLVANPIGPVYDPHIWFDVRLWRMAAEGLGQQLANLDTAHKAQILAQNQKYLQKLDALDAEMRQALQEIPPASRVLITAHDAFAYFGRAYNVEVKALQGVSTLTEYGLRDVSNLVDFIAQRKIKAVFVESSVPRRSLEAVVAGCQSKGHTVKIGGSLYSDALGEAGSGADTYEGMARANLRTIVEGLR